MQKHNKQLLCEWVPWAPQELLTKVISQGRLLWVEPFWFINPAKEELISLSPFR